MEKEIKQSSAPLDTNEGKNKKRNNLFPFLIIAGLLFFVAGIVAFLVVSKPAVSTPLYLMVGIAGIIVILGVVFTVVAIKKGEKHEPDYYAFFIIGLTWIPLGLALDNPVFWMIGLVFIAVGLANRDKWKKKSWKDITPAQKQLKIGLIVFLGLLVLAGVVAYYFVR